MCTQRSEEPNDLLDVGIALLEVGDIRGLRFEELGHEEVTLLDGSRRCFRVNCGTHIVGRRGRVITV